MNSDSASLVIDKQAGESGRGFVMETEVSLEAALEPVAAELIGRRLRELR